MNQATSDNYALKNALLKCDEHTDELDIAYVNGYLTAAVISPVPVDAVVMAHDLFEEDDMVSGEARALLGEAITREAKAIDRLFNADDEDITTIPEEMQALSIWCRGFIALHLQQADSWMEANEQEAGELLLPVIVLSGVFNDEEEFRSIAGNPQLLATMQEQLPEVLTELYLLFNLS